MLHWSDESLFNQMLCSFGQSSPRPGTTGPIRTLALLDMGKGSGIFIKLWNYRLVWVGRDVRDRFIITACKLAVEEEKLRMRERKKRG